MQSFFRRLAACAALFCANPLAFPSLYYRS